jgi:hypothetical protein
VPDELTAELVANNNHAARARQRLRGQRQVETSAPQNQLEGAEKLQRSGRRLRHFPLSQSHRSI